MRVKFISFRLPIDFHGAFWPRKKLILMKSNPGCDESQQFSRKSERCATFELVNVDEIFFEAFQCGGEKLNRRKSSN